MDLDSIDAVDLGRSLKGVGLNLLVRDVGQSVAFLRAVFGMKAFQPTADFAIIQTGNTILQLHADHTYHANPLPSLLPENGARGGGVEIRLYGSDPDAAVLAADAVAEASILQPVTNKPHGLREAYILDADGYCWVPSRPLTHAEIKDMDP
jgi:catechol 2,3-dioxygenase-like lactoylglutathione lyase family enzyme